MSYLDFVCVFFMLCRDLYVCESMYSVSAWWKEGRGSRDTVLPRFRFFRRAATLESVSPQHRAWWENLVTTTTDPCTGLLGHFKPHVHLNDCTSRRAVFKRYAPTGPPFICTPDNRNQSTVLISSHLHPERLISPDAQRIKEERCLLSAHLRTTHVLFCSHRSVPCVFTDCNVPNKALD